MVFVVINVIMFFYTLHFSSITLALDVIIIHFNVTVSFERNVCKELFGNYGNGLFYLSVFSYCMRKVKREVPEDWVCEACVSGNDMVVTEIGGSEDSVLTPTEVVRRDSVPFSAWQVHSKKLRPVETGKVKFITHEEAKMLSSGATKTRSPLRSTWCFKPGSTSKRIPTKPRTVNPKSFCDRMKNTMGNRSGVAKPFRDETMHKSSRFNQHLSQTNESKGENFFKLNFAYKFISSGY